MSATRIYIPKTETVCVLCGRAEYVDHATTARLAASGASWTCRTGTGCTITRHTTTNEQPAANARH